MQTQQPQGGSNLEGEVAETFNQTPLHLAIQYQQLSAVQAILQYKTECCLNRQKGEEMGVIPNFNMADSSGETPLSLAVKNSLMDIAEQLLAGGASVNSQLSGGITLLHRSILDQDPQAALFLLDHGADNTAFAPDTVFCRTSEKETPLELAVKRHLPAVVEALCQRGADLSTPDQSGNSPLWVALETGQEDVASILVQYHSG
ncbi:ANKFY1 [Cordylochernes scorpioides]|uniref:ANKFY1 n=1 Tax=Cordylochernes scorpioides TaxID=51811 RepID=A0ABY6JXI3_9ARAC|nr:ANKFY1 [Cordylochernes scorpioides]